MDKLKEHYVNDLENMDMRLLLNLQKNWVTLNILMNMTEVLLISVETIKQGQENLRRAQKQQITNP